MAAETSLGQTESDVFLSFRGDTRKNFTDNLYYALKRAGINVFRDDEGLQRGEQISTQLKQAIHFSRMSIVVFSKDYASSRWCLEELAEIMECHKIVIPVFYDVDPSDVRHQKKTFAEAFEKHEKHYAEQKDIVNTWRAALTKVANLSGYHLNDGYEGELINKIVSQISTQLNVHGTQELPLLTTKLEGEAFQRNKEAILSWLMDDQVSNVGIFGMGGVGKTTLMKHIQNKLLKEWSSPYCYVYWVTVSQDGFSISKLQNLIAEKVSLKLSNVECENQRAAKLSNALSGNRKYVLILDDLWDYFDVLKVGIPISNRCKLVLTTRSKDICRRMHCKEENVIKLQPLSNEEAWNFFAKELGKYDTEVEQYAKDVARECSGLPLGIRVMASSMRGVSDICEWRNVVEELRGSKVRQGDDMDKEVLCVLKLSYLRLNDAALQKCFLYCALFPEDHAIVRDDLIALLIAEGIIEEKKSIEAEFDSGHAMLNRLENVCLLEGCWDYGNGFRYVKMHDLIRDMAIQELRNSSTMTALVEAGVHLEELTDVKTWTKNLVTVSLMKNYIKEIPDGQIPACPNLSTLLLRENYFLERISNPFFEQFPKLKVVDFSGCYEIKKLPNSISNLVDLVALLLHKLSELKYVPSLAKLRELKMLDLNGCTSVRELPEGLAKLSKLKYLDLTNTNIEEMPKGLLPELRRLQVLKLPIKVVGREVGRLKKMEVLECAFHHVSDFHEYMKSGTQQSLSKYFFLIGDLYLHKTNYSKTVWMDYSTGEGYDSVALPQNIEALYIKRWHALKCFSEDFSASTIQLQSLRLQACNGIESLISTSSCSISHGPPLEKLQHLELIWLEKLYGLIRAEDSTATATTSFPPVSTFSNLKSIKISQCCSLKTLFPPILLPNLHNLEHIEVFHCYEIEEIFATDERSSSTPFPSNPTLSNLKSIHIWSCHRVKKLLPPILLPNLRNLERIKVFNCNELAEIFAMDKEDVGNISSNHPKLRELELNYLPELRSIYNGEVICHSLRRVTLINCPMLKRMPFPLPQPSLRCISAYPKEWWESVEWDNPNAKNQLQSLMECKNDVAR